MSWRVVGYVNGKPIYVDEGPARARNTAIGGVLVVAPSQQELDRKSSREHSQRKRAEK